MSMIEAMGRIEQIQSTLVQLSTAQQPPAGASSTSATAFADALNSTLNSTPGTAASSGISVPTGGATGAGVVGAAEKYIGVPYVFGGEDGSGMDCSGLVQRVYADVGVDVPRLVSGQMKIGTEVGSLAEAKPGDLIVTGGGEHILIYAGDNKVIHAPYEGRDVCLVDAYMTDADIDTIRRVIPATAPAQAAGAAAPTDLLNAAFAALARGGAR